MNAVLFRKSGLWLPAALVALVLLLPTTRVDAAGVTLDVVPSLRLEGLWDSNVAETVENEVSSFGTRIIPTLGLQLNAPDNVMVRVSGSYERVWYYDDDAKDSEYNTWSLRVDSSGAWRLTPTLRVTPSAYFLETENSDRRYELLPAGDPVLPPLSVGGYGRTQTRNFGGALAFEYLFSPKFTLGTSVYYSKEQFTDDTAVDNGLDDNEQVGAELSVSYAVSPITTVGVYVSGDHYMFSDGPDSDVVSAGLRYGRQFSPVLRLNLSVGGSYIREDSILGAEERTDTSPSGSFRLSYLSETFTAALYGSASYSGSSGYNQATMLYTSGLAFTKTMTRTLSLILNAFYQQDESVFLEQTYDTKTFHGSAELRYQPWRHAFFHLRGSANRDEGGQFDTTIDSYSVYLGVTLRNSYNIF